MEEINEQQNNLGIENSIPTQEETSKSKKIIWVVGISIFVMIVIGIILFFVFKGNFNVEENKDSFLISNNAENSLISNNAEDLEKDEGETNETDIQEEDAQKETENYPQGDYEVYDYFEGEE